MFTYLIINILAILFPFVLSFDKKVHFYKYWKYLFPSIILTAAVFITWDIIFTEQGVWGFNEKHLTGLKFFNLPIEECLFFFTIPYACVFTYEVVKAYLKHDFFENYRTFISAALIGVFLGFGLLYYNKLYTTITLLATASVIALFHFVFKAKFLSRFYFAYLIILIPFLLINGILTGSFIEGEIVWYNEAEITGLRIFTIPIEDSVYGLLLILLNVSFFEWFRTIKKI